MNKTKKPCSNAIVHWERERLIKNAKLLKVMNGYRDSPQKFSFQSFRFVLADFYARSISISVNLFSCECCSWQIKCPNQMKKLRSVDATLRWINPAATIVTAIVNIFNVQRQCVTFVCGHAQCIATYAYYAWMDKIGIHRLFVLVLLLGKLIFICMKLTIYRCVHCSATAKKWNERKRSLRLQPIACESLFQQVHRLFLSNCRRRRHRRSHTSRRRRIAS